MDLRLKQRLLDPVEGSNPNVTFINSAVMAAQLAAVGVAAVAVCIFVEVLCVCFSFIFYFYFFRVGVSFVTCRRQNRKYCARHSFTCTDQSPLLGVLLRRRTLLLRRYVRDEPERNGVGPFGTPPVRSCILNSDDARSW